MKPASDPSRLHGVAPSEDSLVRIWVPSLGVWEPTCVSICRCSSSRVWRDVFQNYKTLVYKHINAGLLVIGYFLRLLIGITSFPVYSLEILSFLGELTIRERVTYSHRTSPGRTWEVALVVPGKDTFLATRNHKLVRLLLRPIFKTLTRTFLFLSCL